MHDAVLWVQNVLVPFLGAPGLFLASFLDSSFLSLPEINDLLMITSCARDPELIGLYVVMTTTGSLAGCAVLWHIGRKGGEAFLNRKFGEHRVDWVRNAFQRWNVLALAVPALLPPPMPFKIFVFAAGVFGYSFRRFAWTLLVARGIRYAFWGALGIVYGDDALAYLERTEPWMEAHFPAILGLLAAIVLPTLALRWYRRRRALPEAG